MVDLRLIIITVFASVKIVSASPSVIIVGGGAAGIAAATRLLENNFTDFKILEAESRIGGRINSVELGDSYVDLGARWCHGEDGNIVYGMVKDLNLLESTDDIQTFFLSSRQKLDQSFVKEILNIVHDTYESLSYPSDKRYLSVGEACQQRYETIIHEKYANNRTKLEIAEDAINLLRTLVLSSEGAFSWFDPSLQSDFKNSAGDNHLNWKGKGYKTILDVMMKKYPDPRRSLPIDDKILFDKEVAKISWITQIDGNNIRIRCSDGSEYTADHVIFTPSIGVLKERSDKLFVPRLPTEKQTAINGIGFGAVMKVIMHFPENWWEDSPGFLLVWTEEERKSVRHEFSEGPVWEGDSWITFMNLIFRADHNSNVITVWFTGKLVPAIELLPEELLVRGINFTLNKFLGHLFDIGKPDKILRSTWYANPHFRGSYSFQTIQSRMANNGRSAEENLATPLNDYKGRPIVLFAGEATHPHYYATVHGAIETGYREADALLELYK